MRSFYPVIALLLLSDGLKAQTEQEPNDNTAQANVLPASTSTAGDIGCGNNSDDYFSITTSGDGRLDLSVNTSNTGSPGSLQVQVFNSGGGLIGNTSVASGTPAVLSYECYAAGLYYVRLYRNTGDCYNYSISWSLTQPGFTNDAEPNNNTSEALSLPVNTNMNGHVSFLHYGDGDDYYQFTTTGDGRTTVTFNAYALGSGAVAGAQLQLFNSGGGLLDNWSCDVGSNSVAAQSVHVLDCRAAGLYYLRIYSNGPCGVAYRVKHQFTAPFYVNDAEPNNNSSEADAHPAIDPNTDIDGHVDFLSYGDNDDWYRIQSPDQGIITFTTLAESEGAADGAGMQVQLFNVGGGLLENWSVAVGGNAVPATSTVSTLCKGAGTYYLRVYSNGQCGISYRLRFNGTAPYFANDAEDNDNTAQALNVAYNTYAQGRLAFYYDDNDDYYAITPPDQGVIHFQVMAEHVGTAVDAGLQVQLFNAGGGLIENWSAPVGGGSEPDTIVLNTNCRGTGTYYVRFYTNSPCGVSYKWRYSGTAPVFANDVEDNDNTAQAVNVGYNTSTEGRLAFYYDDNDDYYAIAPADESAIHIEVIAESVGDAESAGLQVQLFNAGGGLLENWSVAVGGGSEPDTTMVNTYCRGAGTYYVRFYVNTSCGVSYKWRYTATDPIFANDAEDNDNTTQAIALGYNETAQGHLAFYYDDNDDYYAITPPDESIIHIEVSAESVGGPVDGGLQVQMFNSGGGLIENWSATVGGGGDPATTALNSYCRGAGTYYVRLYTNSPCGVSYSWHYTGTDPVFGNDVEPNNNTTDAYPINLDMGSQDGRLSFYYGDNDDWYAFTLAAATAVEVNTLAESPGGAGSMQAQLFNSGGGLIGNLSVPIGAADVEAPGTASFGVFPAGAYFLRVYSNDACGVSYRMLCHDVDGDGICDGVALTAHIVPANDLRVTVAPNPSTDGSFHVTSSFATTLIEVFDLDGRRVYQRSMPAANNMWLDLSQEPAGIYSVKLASPDGRMASVRVVRSY